MHKAHRTLQLPMNRFGFQKIPGCAMHHFEKKNLHLSMSFLKIHMNKKGISMADAAIIPHGWLWKSRHSTSIASPVWKSAGTSNLMRKRLSSWPHAKLVKTQGFFLGGSGGLAMCPFVVEISPKTRRKSIHLIEIWPDKKKTATAISKFFSRDQTLLPRLKRLRSAHQKWQQKSAARNNVPLRPIPKLTPW